MTELTGSTGNVAKTYRYNSFGEIYTQTGSLIQPFTFTGREYDLETGLYYYRARYYDPSAGIFIGKDPIGLESGDVNLNRYVFNNPSNTNDPFGWAIWICNRKAKGLTGKAGGNHAYLWDDRKNTCCGMYSTTNCKEKGPFGKDGDSCREVTGSNGLEDKIMKCCKETADKGLWWPLPFPHRNDCHEAGDDCIAGVGLKNPGAPGGRIGKLCDPCGLGASGSW